MNVSAHGHSDIRAKGRSPICLSLEDSEHDFRSTYWMTLENAIEMVSLLQKAIFDAGGAADKIFSTLHAQEDQQ